MNYFGQINAILKDGSEPFTNGEKPIEFKLIDFWRWNTSDLLSNAMRGRLAEFIVGTAVGCNLKVVRNEWDAYDLLSVHGVKIEVKSSSYLQSWTQKGFSKISFSIKPAKIWNPITGMYSETKSRSADFYVFCLLNHKNSKTINPLDLSQWDFFIVPTSFLNAHFNEANTISLNKLQSHFNSIKYDELACFDFKMNSIL